jgi:hypothetical protein
MSDNLNINYKSFMNIEILYQIFSERSLLLSKLEFKYVANRRDQFKKSYLNVCHKHLTKEQVVTFARTSFIPSTH